MLQNHSLHVYRKHRRNKHFRIKCLLFPHYTSNRKLLQNLILDLINYSEVSFISSLVQHLDKNERFVTNQIWINWISVNINITIYYMTKANIKTFHEWSRLFACPGRFLKSMSVTYNLCPIEAGTTGISIVFNHQSQDKIIVYFNWNKWRLDLRGGGGYTIMERSTSNIP